MFSPASLAFSAGFARAFGRFANARVLRKLPKLSVFTAYHFSQTNAYAVENPKKRLHKGKNAYTGITATECRSLPRMRM
jgi:hypothetical protein